MTKYHRATLVFLMVILFGWENLAEVTAPDRSTQLYTTAEKGFSIVLPKSWEKKEGEYGAVVIGISPAEGTGDGFRENVNVVVETLLKTMTSKEYFNASMEGLKKLFSDFKVEKTGTTVIDGKDFHWTIFTHRMGSIKAKVLQYMAVNGIRAYVITGSAAPEKFERYRPQFDQTVKSFKFQ